MKDLHFSETYFNKKIFDDPSTKIRVVVSEHPSLDITEEEKDYLANAMLLYCGRDTEAMVEILKHLQSKIK